MAKRKKTSRRNPAAKRSGAASASTTRAAEETSASPSSPELEDELLADSPELDAADDTRDEADAKGAAPAKKRRSADDEATKRKGGAPAKKKRKGASASDDESASTSKEKVKDASRSKRADDTAGTRRRARKATLDQSPRWLVPLALVFLIGGLFYLVTYYLSAGTLPLAIQDWNLAVGFGLMMVGGGLLMFWK